MRPSVRRLQETYQDRVDFHILNIDLLSSRDLANKYRLVGIPMIVLLDADGEVFQTLFGYQTEEELIAVMETLLADG